MGIFFFINRDNNIASDNFVLISLHSSMIFEGVVLLSLVPLIVFSFIAKRILNHAK